MWLSTKKYNPLKLSELRNKLFCTFTHKKNLENTLFFIQDTYNILHNKIFILESTGTEELICTYNPDHNNMTESRIIPNTILLHRKKETNTLYSINSLNILLRQLNKGLNEHTIEINWEEYRNSMLLTRLGVFTKLDTKIFSIISLN